MKISARLLIVGFVSAVLLACATVPSAFAQTTLTAEQEQKISANCTSIKASLNQLKATDALLRVNRGQVYEAMATKLMDRFNSRLSTNNLDATGPSLITGNYRSALESFRSDYSTYERLLVAAIKVDCTHQPAEFHAAVELARDARSTVHDDVTRLHRIIDDYRLAVGDFLLNYARVAGDE